MNSQTETIAQKEAAAKTELLQGKAVKAEREYEDLELKISNAKTILEDNAQLLKDQQKEHKNFLLKKQEQIDAYQDKIKLSRKKLKKLTEEISERQTYLQEQEKSVNDAIELFNTQMREKQSDISVIERKKDDALQELADLNEQVQEETTKISSLVKRAEQLTKLYEDNVARYRNELRTLQVQITRATADKNKALEEGRVLLEKLRDKEKELQTREQVLNEREASQAKESAYLRKKRAFLEQE